MKKSMKLTACALSAALALQCTIPAFAAGNAVKKDENVFVTLAGDGTVKSQTVSDWLHAEGGLAGVGDASLLTDIVNLKGKEEPEKKGEKLLWNMQDADVYYQGKTDQQLPISAAITYALDGKQLTAAELAGQSGHLVITVKMTNNVTEHKNIDGRNRVICAPFVTMLGTDLPAASFKNVVAEHGTIQTDSTNQLVGFVCLPGAAKAFSGLLTGKLADLQNYLRDTVTIEADVTDCTVPSIMIACATDTELLSEESSLGDFGALFDDLDALRSATDALLDGSAALYDGTVKLGDGAKTLASGIGTLNSGAGTLLSGLGQITAKNDALNAGAGQIADAVLATANAQLAAKLTESGFAGEVPALSWENYNEVLDALIGAIGTEAAETARATLRAAINPQGTLTEEQVNAVLYTANRLLAEAAAPNASAAVTAAGEKATHAAAVQQLRAVLAQTELLSYEPARAVLTNVAIGEIIKTGVAPEQAAAAFAAMSPEEQTAALGSAYAALSTQINPEGALDAETTGLVFALGCTRYAAEGHATFDAAALAAAFATAGGEAQDALYVATAPAADETLVAQAVAESGKLTGLNEQFAAVKTQLGSVKAFVAGVRDYTGAVSEAAAGAKTLADGTVKLKASRNRPSKKQKRKPELFHTRKASLGIGLCRWSITQKKNCKKSQAMTDCNYE